MTKCISPVVTKKFPFQRAVLSNYDVLAALDRGCSMTKIIYVDKEDSDSLSDNSTSEFIILTAALFPNTEFDNALLWLKDKAFFRENNDSPIHLTGAGGVKYFEKIKEILKRDVVFIDEFLSQSQGAYHLLKNVPLHEMTHPEIEIDGADYDNVPFIKNIKHQYAELTGKKVEIKSADDLLPCIFGFMGSAGGFTYIGKDGSFRLVGAVASAGKTFIGLSRCILGTNDYNKITEMASRGDRRNVDTQIKDIVTDKSLFKGFPEDLPMIYMGKLSRTKKDISEFNKDDIAHSLVSMFTYTGIKGAIHCALSERVCNIFFGGNLFQAEVFRKECSILKKTFGLDFVNFFFVNNGNTGVLGAMLCFPDDMDKHFKKQS